MGKCHYPTIDEADIASVQNALDDKWFTHGKRCDEFERKMAAWIGMKHGYFVGSGSSASLLAIAALTSWKLGPKQLRPGDEVITSALAFPTTVAPIVQNGLVPVFVDVSLAPLRSSGKGDKVDSGTCNVVLEQIKKATTDRTKAVVIANTLGNPIDYRIRNYCDSNNLWLVEDNCDGLGGEYGVVNRKTGTIGHLSTLSFYPAHHITTGEGGMVLTDDDTVGKIVRSLRDWGRDCSCQGGQDGVCGKRFQGQHGDLPYGYDHKYVFSHLGYNLKNTELAAALGLSQLNKLESFVEARRNNWKHYLERLQPYSERYGCQIPSTSKPSWFGYLIICENKEICSKTITHLEKNGIQTRRLFGGNMLRQPCFKHGNINYRVSGSLANTDYLTNNSFWLGVAPSVTKEQIDKTCDLLIGLITT